MNTVRLPAVAGVFYPADPGPLAAAVDACLPPAGESAAPPKILIVPHAGYVYSGATAGAAYACLQVRRSLIRRVVLLGPTHRVAVNGLAIPDATAFRTPLGDVPIDREALAAVRHLPGVVVSDAVHAQEHALEVHLPFLQRVLASFSLVPVAVGRVDPETVAAVLEHLWGGPETLIVVSTDLSHYLEDALARQVDRQTCAQILALDPHLQPTQACGAYSLNGALLAARRHGLRPTLVAACNSGEVSGDRQRVVGYAAFTLAADAGVDHG